MNKKIAFDNRLCYERDVLRQHALHHQKLQTMLPTCASPSKVYLDSNAPPRRAHLANNRKKLQLEKERQTEIYTQNQRLAAKMEHIQHRQETAVLAAGTPLSPRGERSPQKLSHQLKPVHSPAQVHMPGIRLDSSQTPMVDCYLSPEYAMGRGNACKKSTLINRGVQRQRQQQIEEENRRQLERLKALKPFYNTKKWDADWQQAGAKFQHLHQDATVGHLLPKTSHGASPGSPTRSPLAAARRVRTPSGLPSIKPKTSHGTSRHTTNPPSRGGQGGIDNDLEDDEPEIVECGPFALLEATTRKGVEIFIEELQIELRDEASGCVQPGDRGLLVRACWGSHVATETVIMIDTLARIAQEIDDLEMMIKLETVSTLAGTNNFPRLSVLLTDDELQKLLLKLVQVLHVQLSEDETQLEITSRLLRPPSPSVRDDKTRPTCRPRTCPSTLHSEPHAITPAFELGASKAGGGDDVTSIDVELDVDEEEIKQYHRVLCKQLAVLLNGSARRTGFHAGPSHGYQLVQFWLHPQDAELHVTLLPLRQDMELVCEAIPMDGSEIVAMLEQIQHHGASPVEAVRRFIRGWRATTT